jgi:hypothetical protein
MYRLGGTLTPMAQHIDAGRFEVKTGTSQASNHAFSQARLQPKVCAGSVVCGLNTRPEVQRESLLTPEIAHRMGWFFRPGELMPLFRRGRV